MKDIVDILVDLKDKVWNSGRTSELGQLAKEHNLGFSKREKFTAQDYRIKDFKLFKNKKGIRFKGVIHYSDEQKKFNTRIYDYFGFVDGEEKKTTVVELFHPKLNLTKIEIRPKRTIKWAKEIIIREKVLFPELERFNAFYEIISPNPEKVEYELNGYLLDLISTKKGLRIEGEGNYLLLYYRHKLIPLKKIMEEHQFLLELSDYLINPPSPEGFV